jgi:hypothetical protein
VRPPRLGGNRRLGVFGTRSNFRPNPLGLSVVALEGIDYENGTAYLRLKGIDILDATPILDIKPYLPYADCRPEASGGFAQNRPEVVLKVVFADPARAVLKGLPPGESSALARLLVQVLRLDPRPAYYGHQGPKNDFGMYLLDWNVRWRLHARTATVIALEKQTGRWVSCEAAGIRDKENNEE